MATKKLDPIPSNAPTPVAYTPKGFAALINNGADGSFSEHVVRKWCATDKIPGATKIGGRWLIPGSAVTALFADARREAEPRPPRSRSELSSKDLAIVRGMAAGQSYRQIGLELHLTEDTIGQYVKRIREKLGAHHRAHLIAIAKDQGLI